MVQRLYQKNEDHKNYTGKYREAFVDRVHGSVATKEKEDKVGSASVGKMPIHKVKITKWMRYYHTKGPFPLICRGSI